MKFFLFLFAFSLSANLKNTTINAKSAILINADTGVVLYEKQSEVPMYPASITKVATAFFALDQKKPTLKQKMNVSSEAIKVRPEKETGFEPAYLDEKSGTKMWLVAGEHLPFESLLHGMIRCSGNDAANVIAENLSGSIPQFVSEMNEYFFQLGCKNTHFKNPHGIHHKEHYTTARDMGIIFRKALKNKQFREVSSNGYYQRPKTNRQPGGEILQKDPLLVPGKYYYPKAFSVKKGFHSDAKHTIVAAAKDGERTLLVVLLGCESAADRCKDAISLFEAAFNETKEKKVLFKAFSPIQLEIKGTKKQLKATVLSDLAIEYFPSEEPTCKAFVQIEKNPFPISKGQKVGKIVVQDLSGKMLQTGELISMENLKPTLLEKMNLR